MSTPVRWSSKAILEWTPILTFTRRRMAVLDWFEENLELVAFTDDPDHAGIAVGNPYQRLRFDRTRLQLSALAVDASARPLEPALQGLWGIVEPKKVTFSRYIGAWSFPLDADYDAARSRFAKRVVGPGFGETGHAFDAACLVDVATATGIYKIEFGVVTADELSERLENPEFGMLGAEGDDHPVVEVDADDLPPVSVFLDVRGMFATRQRSAAKVLSQLDEVEADVSRLAAEIGSAL